MAMKNLITLLLLATVGSSASAAQRFEEASLMRSNVAVRLGGDGIAVLYCPIISLMVPGGAYAGDSWIITATANISNNYERDSNILVSAFLTILDRPVSVTCKRRNNLPTGAIFIGQTTSTNVLRRRHHEPIVRMETHLWEAPQAEAWAVLWVKAANKNKMPGASIEIDRAQLAVMVF